MSEQSLENTATESARNRLLQSNESAPLPLSLCFDLPPALSNIAHLRKTSRCLLESLGFSRESTDDVETLIGELSTNVVRHAHTGNSPYQVSLKLYGDRIVVTVIDTGVGFVEEAVPEPGTTRSDTLQPHFGDRIGGLGLPLIHAIADHVEIQPTSPHGTTVRAEKILHLTDPEPR
jgi:anti-sigma regulatory factor (Ser/Thr protein kinase)